MDRSPNYRALQSNPDWLALWGDDSRVVEEARRLERLALQTDPGLKDAAYEAACRLAGLCRVREIVEQMADAQDRIEQEEVRPAAREPHGL